MASHESTASNSVAVAYTPFAAQSQRHQSPTDDGAASATGPVAAPGSRNSDPYYDNDEIAILLEIVTNAQANIDRAREPKPLPVAALFRAYDLILPQHGIDPDSDHHLSAFIFRVGGERGDQSLLDKFQTVLGRMDITLEFGDGDSASAVSSRSPDASDGLAVRPVSRMERRDDNGLSDDDEGRPLASTDVRSPESQRSGLGRVLKPSRALQYARSQALSSAYNRWSNGPVQDRRDGDQVFGVDLSRPGSSNAESTHTFDPPPKDNFPQRTPQTAFKSVRHSLLELPEKDGPNGETPVVPRPSVLSMLDAWPRSAGTQKMIQASHIPRSRSSQTPDLTTNNSSQNVIPEARKDNTVQPTASAAGQESASPMQDHEIEDSSKPAQQAASPPVVQTSEPDTRSPTPRPFDIIPETPHPEQSKAGLSALETERERHLAKRAREIYLGSKVFNHWADKTARRLEREAVARRHMIRFRCFRGWCQPPSLQDPAVHRLRITTAAQKLRRAVAEREEQLRLAALAASEARRSRTIQKALDVWTGHKARSEARLWLAQRTRVKAAAQWLSRAKEDVATKDHLIEQHKRGTQITTVRDWSRFARTGAARAAAAKQIGDFRVSFRYLRTWWDQAEIRRRSEEYRRRLLAEKASYYFDLWNLQARAQAFIWRNQYVTVNRLFGMWCRMAQEDLYQQHRARQLIETRYRIKYSEQMTSVVTRHSELGRLSRRARLYIKATHVLAVFERAAEKNKARQWRAVKRHLQRRYEEVSAKKKERAFFIALGTWRNATFRAQLQSDRAKQIASTRLTSQRSAALSIWTDACANAENREYEAQVYYARNSWKKWSHWAEGEEQLAQQLEVMVQYQTRRLHHRSWAMATLQQSGLGHTAAMAAEKYEREKRMRILRKWRQHSDKGKGSAVPSSVFSSPLRGGPVALPERPKSAFKARPPTQRVLFASQGPGGRAQLGSIPDTPTRWTGRPMFAKSVMSPLQEADEEDIAAVVKSREEHTSASLASMLKSVKRTPMKLPWPTPDAVMSADIVRQPRLPRIFGVTTTPMSDLTGEQLQFGASEPTITGRTTGWDPDQPPPSTWRRPPPPRRQSLNSADRAGPSQSKLSRPPINAGDSVSGLMDTPTADDSIHSHSRSTIRPLSAVRGKIPQTTHIIRTRSPTYPK